MSVGHHGWGGDPPRTEEQARQRIITATTRCIERMGVRRTTLSNVAEEVGVTRQTVYRYFPNLAELLNAVAATGAADFLERSRTHLAGARTPLDAVVESMIYAMEELPREPRIGILLEAGEETLFGRGMTSSVAFELGAQVLRGLVVDWPSVGVHTEDDFEELVEVMMRLMASFLQHPPTTPRTPDDLRAFVRRWLGPALTGGPIA